MTEITIAGIAGGLAKKQFSSREITETLFKRIEQLDPQLKAFNRVSTERAQKEAAASDERRRTGRTLGILDGVPYVAKDLVETAGVETTGSSEVLKGYIPKEDATIAARLRDAGCVLLGKTNTHQFAYGVQTPPTRNPWDMKTPRVPGGSSGGTGAAVAAQMTPFGLGTDTGGSIRIPSCLNGITGLKATFGRIPKDGVLVMSFSYDNVGPMCWTAADVASVLNVTAGRSARDPNSANVPVEDYTKNLHAGVKGLRAGIPANYFESHFPEVTKRFQESAEALKKLGAELVTVNVPPSMDLCQSVGFAYVLAETAAWHGPRLRRQEGDYWDEVRSYLKAGEMMLATDYINMQRFRQKINNDFRRMWEDARLDIMLTPTLAVTAAEHGQMMYHCPDGWEETLMSSSIRCTFPFNLTGQPALTVPNGFDDKGLPTGLQIIAKPWADALVLRVGHAYQQVTDWHSRRPKDLSAVAI